MNTSQTHISFYSHRAENFAVYISIPAYTSRALPGLSPLTSLGSRTAETVWASFSAVQFGSSTGPRISSSSATPRCLPVPELWAFPFQLQILKCFVVLKLDLELLHVAFFFFFTSSSPRSASSKNVQTVRSTHCILKTRMGPGNLEATDSTWATSGIFQSQSKFHMFCRWAKWCTWWPWAHSLWPSLVTCPTELPEPKPQRSCSRTSPASPRVHFVLARVPLFGRTVEQARKYFQFALGPSLKWWPGPCLSEKKATRETRKTEPHWKSQQVLTATPSLKTTISAFLH